MSKRQSPPTTGEYLAMSTFTDTPGVPEIALGMLFPHLRITKVVRINPWVISVEGTDWRRGDMVTSFFLPVSGQSFPVDGDGVAGNSVGKIRESFGTFEGMKS